MFYSTLAYIGVLMAAPVAVTADTVRVDCFASGQRWAPEEPDHSADHFCKTYWSVGSWAPGQKTQRCTGPLQLYDGSTYHIRMEVNNDSDEERTLTYELCDNFFWLFNCGKGGKFKHDGWFVR